MSDQHWTDRLLGAGEELLGIGERVFGVDETSLDLGEQLLPEVGHRPERPHRPDGFAEAPPPWADRPAAPTATCPVPHHDQQQLERWLRWCTREFGPAADQPAVSPTAAFYPHGYRGSNEQVEELVRRVSTVMRVQAPTVEVRHFEGEAEQRRTTVGTYHDEDGRPVVSLDLRARADPALLTAVIAHELAHVRLRGEGRLPAWEPEEERFTDFLTVHLGMGVFTANAAHRFSRTTRGWSALPLGDLTDKMLAGTALGATHHLGYLTDQQFGYALACWTHRRADPSPAWGRHLTPTIRAHLQRGLAYLRHSGHRLDD
jgi:hypothetical protein